MNIYLKYAISCYDVIGKLVILGIFLEIFAEKIKLKKLAACVLWTGVILGNCLLAYSMRGVPFLKQVLIILFTSLIMRYMFRQKFKRMLILVMLYQAAIIVVEYLEYSVIGYFWGISEAGMDVAIGGVLIMQNLIVFCLVLALKCFFPGYKSVRKRNMLTDKEWAVFSVFPLFSIVVVLVMYINFGVVQAPGGSVMLCIACGMGVMNIVMFYLMNGIIKREQQIAENRLFRQKMESQTKEYYSMLENYERQRKRVHEFKNHIAVILALAKQGETFTSHTQEKLAAYLKKMQEENLKLSDSIDTNHALINAILNSKYQEAKNKGITFVIKINDLSDIFISDEDIVVILYNLLNNAFEACERCEKKIVRIKLVQEQRGILLSVMNTSGGAPTKRGEKFLTDKEDRDFHGIGIENIKETVEKYGGTYTIKYEEQIFKFIILIPTERDLIGT